MVMASLQPALLESAVRLVLDEVYDPELPMLTIADLGVLREVRIEDGRVTVVITPTYCACPAMHAIAQDIRTALGVAGYGEVHIETQLAPAWSTDQLSAAAHVKLRVAGIAPPAQRAHDKRALLGHKLLCPRCASDQTECVSAYGATACKALYRCRNCLEPFDYFKCL